MTTKNSKTNFMDRKARLTAENADTQIGVTRNTFKSKDIEVWIYPTKHIIAYKRRFKKWVSFDFVSDGIISKTHNSKADCADWCNSGRTKPVYFEGFTYVNSYTVEDILKIKWETKHTQINWFYQVSKSLHYWTCGSVKYTYITHTKLQSYFRITRDHTFAAELEQRQIIIAQKIDNRIVHMVELLPDDIIELIVELSANA